VALAFMLISDVVGFYSEMRFWIHWRKFFST